MFKAHYIEQFLNIRSQNHKSFLKTTHSATKLHIWPQTPPTGHTKFWFFFTNFLHKFSLNSIMHNFDLFLLSRLEWGLIRIHCLLFSRALQELHQLIHNPAFYTIIKNNYCMIQVTVLISRQMDMKCMNFCRKVYKTHLTLIF